MSSEAQRSEENLIRRDVKNLIICDQEFKAGKYLGSGTYGDVYDNEEGKIVKKSGRFLFTPLHHLYKAFWSEMRANNLIEDLEISPKTYLYVICKDSKEEVSFVKLYIISDKMEIDLWKKYSNSGVCLKEKQLERIMEILYLLHKKGLSHMDTKPDNFMIKEGKIYIIDFGLSKFFEDIEKPYRRTLSTAYILYDYIYLFRNFYLLCKNKNYQRMLKEKVIEGIKREFPEGKSKKSRVIYQDLLEELLSVNVGGRENLFVKFINKSDLDEILNTTFIL